MGKQWHLRPPSVEIKSSNSKLHFFPSTNDISKKCCIWIQRTGYLLEGLFHSGFSIFLRPKPLHTDPPRPRIPQHNWAGCQVSGLSGITEHPPCSSSPNTALGNNCALKSPGTPPDPASLGGRRPALWAPGQWCRELRSGKQKQPISQMHPRFPSSSLPVQWLKAAHQL